MVVLTASYLHQRRSKSPLPTTAAAAAAGTHAISTDPGAEAAAASPLRTAVGTVHSYSAKKSYWDFAFVHQCCCCQRHHRGWDTARCAVTARGNNTSWESSSSLELRLRQLTATQPLTTRVIVGGMADGPTTYWSNSFVLKLSLIHI